MAGFLDKAKCKNVMYDLMKSGQDLNDIHVADIFSQPNEMTTASRMGWMRTWIVFRLFAQLLELERSSGHRAFLEVLAHREATSWCWLTNVQSYRIKCAWATFTSHRQELTSPKYPQRRRLKTLRRHSDPITPLRIRNVDDDRSNEKEAPDNATTG